MTGFPGHRVNGYGMTSSSNLESLRAEVRAFVAVETVAGRIRIGEQAWTTWDRDFSVRCAEQGYIAMTWPKEYGGHERSPHERLLVCEELLAAGAPLGAHWIADRQSGPQILRNGTETLKRKVLPEIASGHCTFCIGMSEPDSGSDLSSIRSKATRDDGGWLLNGRKVWATNAQHSEYMIVLCRTEPKSEDRYRGMTQLVVDMKAQGVTTRPIVNIAGDEEFNEVVFDDVLVPDDHVLGDPGDGWRLVTEELSFERSGPDRFLSTFGVLRLMVDACGPEPDRHEAVEIGRLTARLTTIRSLSIEIADRLIRDEKVGATATIMKDMGTQLEQKIPDVARRLLENRPSHCGDTVSVALAKAILYAPCFTLRGGTREILKGIIARDLGLR